MRRKLNVRKTLNNHNNSQIMLNLAAYKSKMLIRAENLRPWAVLEHEA
jgi:hypothetical protein